jgi:DNA-binding helix-hairpin-helix protein with protein kinase domain
MSRTVYPTLLRDHLGNEVRLATVPFATGGEGAVFDVVGQPNVVAKLYNKPQAGEHCDKLRAMARLCSPNLLKIAAWPTATLSNGNQSEVLGILMPRITDHKEIHNLYSVAQRKKDFPEADWGFLLHTARNCASAFENVHSQGHVVGDVNQKNLMVSKKGIVALVDCDSFQVREGARIFRCAVGVPEYTPPELHGKRFSELDRNANHDVFGLAIMIFHLLMMGRHPFAGVPQGSDDIPIEKAIQGYLYAYSRNVNRLKQPPHVPPLLMLDASTRDLFERAFRSLQRPTATEWRGVLDDSMAGLQRCKNDRKHSYPAAAGSCPWCRLIAVDRLMFFVPTSQGTASVVRRIENFRGLISKLAGMRMELPFYTRPQVNAPGTVTLPAHLSAITKPVIASHPHPPTPIQKPVLVPLPSPPVVRSKPILRSLPVPPATPPSPELMPYPPAPSDFPAPKLLALPDRPVCPALPDNDPLDPLLQRFSLFWALVGVLVYFIAKPVGVITMGVFGIWWLIMKFTEDARRKDALISVQKQHEAEWELTNARYDKQVQPLVSANRKSLDLWTAANAAKAAKHAQNCKVIQEENRSRLAAWEADIAKITNDHQRVVREVEHENRRTLSAWETETSIRQDAYDQQRKKIDQENGRLIWAWEKLNAQRLAEHQRKCREVDAANQKILTAWEHANAPWIEEQKRWRRSAQSKEEEISRLETALMTQRASCTSRFQQRLATAEKIRNSCEDALRDYESDLRQAELNARQLQLDLHLDNSLICNARIKGISADRILALESFGVETARDVEMLKNKKIPGIGPVLSRRLFDWRDKVASSFRPKQGLPESETLRIASRYAPTLLPVVQDFETAMSDLERIAIEYRSYESNQVRAIADALERLSVANAFVQAMNIV